MNDNAEGGIAAVQARAAQGEGIGRHHRTTVGYLNERIVVFVATIALVALVGVWATSSSPFLLYGSLAIAILLVVLWGVLRIRRINAVRAHRAQQVREIQQGDS
jgi:type VI protein secretion system component VasK